MPPIDLDPPLQKEVARVENTKLAEGTVLEDEAGTGSGWISLPVTFRRC